LIRHNITIQTNTLNELSSGFINENLNFQENLSSIITALETSKITKKEYSKLINSYTPLQKQRIGLLEDELIDETINTASLLLSYIDMKDKVSNAYILLSKYQILDKKMFNIEDKILKKFKFENGFYIRK